MLKDRRTWTTIAYFILMLPIGITYFVTAVVGLSVSLAFIFAPIADILGRVGVAGFSDMHITAPAAAEWMVESVFVLPLLMLAGSLTADLDHASGARRRTAARHVREGAAGRPGGAVRAGGRRGTSGTARRSLAASPLWRVVARRAAEGVIDPPSAWNSAAVSAKRAERA